ncbi:ATP/GTP-binding protein [Prevotella sp. E2-28]|uniref:AAA family ATPase n=1 Tax=Prevotella sp. E2-28 TaxID=2913620 RepID=UPI001EDA8B36|nr:ATP-binding protein [Prevotella sp. E2-28]UKK54389.1 ATP-binding protein [Prevotella sp. E2-28]
MIQEFRVSNFLSFKEEAVLNFEATKDEALEKELVVEVAPGVRLLRLAVVYGANASGKSNLLAAIDFLQNFWFQKRSDIDESTEAVPFLFDEDTPQEASKFELKFYVNGVRYWYSLELDKHQVYSEKLYYYKSTQPTMLFTRLLENGQSVIKINTLAVKTIAGAVDEISLKCLRNMSFFAARQKVNCSLPLIDEARNWMKSGMLPVIEPETRMFEYAGSQMLKDNALKDFILKFVNKAGSNITGVKMQEEKYPIPGFMRDAIIGAQELSKEVKDKLLEDDFVNKLNSSFEHTVKNQRGVERYYLSNDYQSDGTRRLFGIEAAIYELLNNGSFLTVDEIESSLHPDLLELILEEFLENTGHSQLLFTTHYDPLLDAIDELLRKDSVWFTDKGEDGGTKLYSLTEFKRLNKIASFQRSYRRGLFKAVPNIKRE